jgi:hypothetical protein
MGDHPGLHRGIGAKPHYICDPTAALRWATVTGACSNSSMPCWRRRRRQASASASSDSSAAQAADTRSHGKHRQYGFSTLRATTSGSEKQKVCCR